LDAIRKAEQNQNRVKETNEDTLEMQVPPKKD